MLVGREINLFPRKLRKCSLQVKNHTLTVIGTDSFSVKPLDIKSFTLLSGERIDVVLHTTSDKSVGKRERERSKISKQMYTM